MITNIMVLIKRIITILKDIFWHRSIRSECRKSASSIIDCLKPADRRVILEWGKNKRERFNVLVNLGSSITDAYRSVEHHGGVL